jgi:PAS domain S-box-containing protein
MTEPEGSVPKDRRDPIPANDVIRIHLESTTELVCVIDREDRVEYVNRAAAAVGHFRPEEMVGRRRSDLFPTGLDSHRSRALEEVFRTGTPIDDHQVVWHADPDILLEAQLQPIKNPDGSVRAVLVICRDITRRRQAEEQILVQRDLAFSLAAATGVVEAMQLCLDAAIRSSGMDCGGAYLVDQAGTGMDLVCWRNLSDRFIEAAKHYPLDSRQARYARNDKPVYMSINDFAPDDIRLLSEEGLRSVAVLQVVHGARPVARLNVASRSLLEVPQSARGALESIALQIGSALARIGAQESLRRSEHLYRITVDSMEEWLHVVDSDFRIILINEPFRRVNRELGLAEDPIGQRPWEYYTFLPSKVQEEYRQVFKTGKALTTEEEIAEPGRTLTTRTTKIPIFDAGRVVYVITLVQDISKQVRAEKDRDRLEAQMQQAQKFESLGVLAGGVAHDFNNILTGIIGNAELTLAEIPAGSKVAERIQRIRSAAYRASDLTGQMLDFSGQGTRTSEPILLSEVVREMSSLLEASIPKKTRLDYRFEEGLQPVAVDATQIRQVVMNLILNASEAIGEAPGVITVRTWTERMDRDRLAGGVLPAELAEGVYMGLEVRDTGCGMDPDTVARIFDPFFTTKFTGRGLGLAAVLGIIRGHRGTIRVESRPGLGSLFQILLPASGEAPMRLPEGQNPDVGMRFHGLVLVVDGEAAIREMARDGLDAHGFRVEVASDAGGAMALLQRVGKDARVLVLDLSLPDMGGREFLSRISREFSGLPVVVTSDLPVGQDLHLGDSAAVHFLKKPYGTADLLTSVREALAANCSSNRE